MGSTVQAFVIQGRLSSLNDYINACRTNPHMGAKLKRENQERVIKAINEWDVKPMETPVTLHIIWIEPNTRRDKDNVRSGVKYILDGLVESGIIANDGWKHIVNIYDEYKVNKESPRVCVRITNVPE